MDRIPCQLLPSPVAPKPGRLPVIEFVEFRRWDRVRHTPVHRHEDLFQIDYFPEGEGSYRINGVSHPIDSLTFFFIPPGCSHEIQGDDKKCLLNLTIKFHHDEIGRDDLPPLIRLNPDDAREVEHLLRSAISEVLTQKRQDGIIASLRLVEALTHLKRVWLESREPQGTNLTVNLARRFIRERSTARLSLGDIAKSAGVTGSHLCRLFKKEVGITPFFFLQRIRVDSAKYHLAHTREKIFTIAQATGFGSARDMSRIFKQMERVSPREYRRMKATASPGSS